MNPNARAILINGKKTGQDELVDKVLADLSSPEGKLYVEAKRIFASKIKRNYLEACLLCSGDLGQISTLLEMELETVTMYRDIYYNVTDLDKLSKLELLDVDDKDESTLKLWAFSQGLTFISWRLGNIVAVSPVEGLKDLFTTCIYKSKEAMFNGNISEASKESTKYIKLAMDLARLLKVWVMDSDGAKKDLELALKEVCPNFEGLDSLGDESLAPSLGNVESIDSFEFESLDDLNVKID